MDVSSKIAVVNQYIKAFDTSDIDLITNIFATTATVEDPVGSEVQQGIDNILRFYQRAFDMDISLKLVGQPRCAGNAVAFSFQVIMKDKLIDIIDVFEFDDSGKVISMKAYWGVDNITKLSS